MAGSAPEWDRFWRYDRLSSFETGPGAANYSGETAEGWRKFFADIPYGGAMLDIATGNGAIAVLAVEAGRNLDVTGSDLADIAPDQFVTTSDALRQVTFRGRTNAELLPFEDSTFDAVTSQFGIEYSDMAKSLPEAMRVLKSGGRLRLAMHAAEGAVVHDTNRSLADADFLLDRAQLIPLAVLSLNSLVAWEKGEGLKEKAQSDHAQFRAALEAVEQYERQAMDRQMLASVRRDLIEAFNTHRQKTLPDQIAGFRELASQVQDHRERQRALVRAAVARDEVEGLAARLAEAGFTDVGLGEQRREEALLAHVLEATAP
ncbi:class I SAM-dependent methyltransferase [Sphingomonas sp. HDW15A]|uniref:class I SAM-dependent methyltransferase n=1 Tax=Sphingomonas sp. HDW15A TaxID=2714942 RepID=UPI001408D0AC|nr:class I SAM-dependent methyltransferase [Sphingomonas sp. HDW15A]QIK95334.1 class I SAM-dependent methyltransferase [Sphingomonas sp. HDW15A]